MTNRGRRGQVYDTSTNAPSGLTRLRIAAWLKLLLVVFNLAAGSAQSLAGTTAIPVPQDHITICTAAGMVVLDHGGQTRQPSAHESFCGFCLPLMHSGVIAPGIEASGYRRFASNVGVLPPVDHRRPVLREGFNPHSARAPPPPV
jgi:hypothetical protein